MNEKLEKLAEQAVEYIELPMPDEVYHMGDDVFRRHKSFNRERFAELIVAECVEQILTGVRTDPPGAEPPELVQILVRRIKRHFGVE
jgi:hypothetical protein